MDMVEGTTKAVDVAGTTAVVVAGTMAVDVADTTAVVVAGMAKVVVVAVAGMVAVVDVITKVAGAAQRLKKQLLTNRLKTDRVNVLERCFIIQ